MSSWMSAGRAATAEKVREAEAHSPKRKEAGRTTTSKQSQQYDISREGGMGRRWRMLTLHWKTETDNLERSDGTASRNDGEDGIRG